MNAFKFSSSEYFQIESCPHLTEIYKVYVTALGNMNFAFCERKIYSLMMHYTMNVFRNSAILTQLTLATYVTKLKENRIVVCMCSEITEYLPRACVQRLRLV